MRALHTPTQETNSAYNPGVTYRGGEFLAAGINQAGNALAEGLQRFQANKAENSALDMAFESRAKPILTDLERFAAKDGKVDETAAGLMDKGADWHKLGASQKKQVLADIVLLGDRRERERREAEAKTYRDATLALQGRQFEESLRGNRVREDMDWRRFHADAGQRVVENVRALDADRRAEANFLLNQQTGQFNLGQAQTRAAQGLADRNARLRFLQLAAPVEVGPMPTPQFNARLAEQQTGGIIPAEELAAMEKLGRSGFAPTGHTVRVGGWNVPVVTTSNGQAQMLPELATADDGTANPRYNKPAAQAQLAPQALSAVLKAESRYSDALTKFRANRADPKLQAELDAALANLNHIKRVTGAKAPAAAPPSAPAAPAAGGQPIRYKLVNGQLVQE